MWAGCEKGAVTIYQQYSNHHNIYLLDNIDNLNMARPWDRYWINEWNDYFDQPPEFKENIYWNQDTSVMQEAFFPDRKTWSQ